MARLCQKERRWVRRFLGAVALGMFVCSGLFAQTKTAVAGMSRFTDAQFGFSFWYPAGWKVMDEPVADPTEQGWFPNATIIRELHVRNPAALKDHDQPGGVIVRDLRAPKGLTELGGSKSASPVGVDQRYFFDSGTRRWMYARLSVGPSGEAPATHPAEISRKTIGGLPIFWGAARHGAEVIVPLDETHFLAISTMDPGGDDGHVYLAATVVATDPHAGKLASEQVQEETIRREGVELGVIRRSVQR